MDRIFGYAKQEINNYLQYVYQMGLKEIVSTLNRLFNILTDWFLILAGGLLIVKAVFAVDVPVARYTIIAMGLLLSGFGLWYRSRRKRRDR